MVSLGMASFARVSLVIASLALGDGHSLDNRLLDPVLSVCATHWGSVLVLAFEFGADRTMVVLGTKDLEKRWKSALSVDEEEILSLIRDNTGLMRGMHTVVELGNLGKLWALALALALLEDAEKGSGKLP
jgi:hypothetical protein